MQAICRSCMVLAPVLPVLTPVIMVLLFLCVSGNPLMEDSGHGHFRSCQYPYSIISSSTKLAG